MKDSSRIESICLVFTILTGWTGCRSVDCPAKWKPERTLVDDDVCYLLHEEVKEWTMAKQMCELAGGRLTQALDSSAFAGLKINLIKDILDRLNADCFWIGLSDQQTEGVYKWVQESNVRISIVDTFGWLRDCGAICKARFELFGFFPFKQYMKQCRSTLPYACQYVPLKGEQSSGHSSTIGYQDLDTSTKPYELVSKEVRVIRKIESGHFVLERPLWERQAHASTMCIRLCFASNPGCRYVNYNYKSGECRAFPDTQEVTMDKRKYWNVWKYIK